MIDIDITAVIQFVNFLITLVVLNFLLITPIRKILQQRQEHLDQLQGVVVISNEESEEKLEKYNSSLAEIRKEAAARREVLRAEAINKEREINENALSEAHARIQKARADISAQVDVALAELKGAVPDLAKEAAGKIMA